MQIAVASVLELEHADLPTFAHRNAAVIVLAGDIHVSPLGVKDAGDPCATLEQLAALHERGILSDAEFGAKKTELLRRI